MNTPEKNKDGELSGLVVVMGIFTIALIIIDLTYKNLGGMFIGPDWWNGVVWSVLHVMIAAAWFIVIKYHTDPNKNFFRVVLLGLLVAAIALTMFHRAGWLEDKQVIIDSKEEQTR